MTPCKDDIPAQVAADEAAAAKRLELSRYTDYRYVELDATSDRRIKEVI